jgi:hypothetical protein
MEKTITNISIIVFIVLLFFTRTLLFVNSYGALEHDSGWNLGLAKNLSQRGIYASYTNTNIKDGNSNFENIHRRFSLQDENGFTYFPAAVGVGPGYIVPQSLMLKIFGNGWWQYRTWPLLGFILLLSISFFIVRKYGGVVGLLFFSVWLWMVPQFTIQMAYEALSEHIALLYLLSGYLCLYFYDQHKKLWLPLLSGIMFSFSYLTKTIFVLPILGVLVYLQCDYFRFDKDRKLMLKKWLILFFGLLIPILTFNIYKHDYLNFHFGEKGLNAQRQEQRLVFSQSGSGADPAGFIFQSRDFLSQKLSVWSDVGIRVPIFIWVRLLLSPIIFIKYPSGSGKIFLTSLYFAALVSFIWYLFFSPDGWGRHIWQGLFIGMLLISISLGLVFAQITAKYRILFLTLLIPICLFLVNFQVVNAALVFDKSIITDWATVRKSRGLDGFPTNPILSLQDQKELVNFFSRNIKSDDRVYYLLGFLNAEISPLVDKVFYSIERYVSDGQKNPDGGKAILIIGPYQQGIWSDRPENYVSEVKANICNQILFQNPSYLLCTIKSDLFNTSN